VTGGGIRRFVAGLCLVVVQLATAPATAAGNEVAAAGCGLVEPLGTAMTTTAGNEVGATGCTLAGHTHVETHRQLDLLKYKILVFISM